MSNEIENKIVPKLRFPDFRDAGEWERTSLGQLIEIKGRIGYRGYTIEDIVNKGEGAISLSPSNINEAGSLSFEKSTYISWAKYEESPEIMLEKGFTVLVKTGSTFGKTALVDKLPEKSTINPQIVVLKPVHINSVFLFLIVSNSAIQKQIKETVVGGAIPTLSQDSISKFQVLVPPNKIEQQKIADCLSSLDELIVAHNQKLAGLKAHKKGLMQQLFPAEGETVPMMRFPEFRDSGEWEVKEFLEYIVLYRGSSPRPIQNYLTKDSTGVNWIKIGDTKFANNFTISQVDERITLEGAEKSRKVNVGELILANSMSFGKTYQLSIDGFIYDGWFVLRKYEQYFEKQFLLQLLNSDNMQKQYKKFSAGGIVQNISSDIVYKTLLPKTTLSEQQKIADCLSSLDELITVQAEKIDALKTHKKGLMQQLFPNTNDISE